MKPLITVTPVSRSSSRSTSIDIVAQAEPQAGWRGGSPSRDLELLAEHRRAPRYASARAAARAVRDGAARRLIGPLARATTDLSYGLCSSIAPDTSDTRVRVHYLYEYSSTRIECNCLAGG